MVIAHQRFHLKNLNDLRFEAIRLDVQIPIDENVSILSRELVIGDRLLWNRFAVQPMEGFDSLPDGSPGELTFRRYQRYARGGFSLIWMEATAVMEEARSNPNQLYLHKGNVAAFKELVKSIRDAARDSLGRDVILILQLTHSGRYSKPTGRPKPIIAHHSPILDPLHNLPEDYPLVTDDYLDRLQDVFVDSARLAAEAGIDGVDIKSVHRYLLSELLASFTREGKYGGSFENRTRLLLEVLARIRAEVPEVFITSRMNAYDAIPYPYGFGVSKDDVQDPDLTEPIELVHTFRKMEMPILNISIGNPYYKPHYGRPFDTPLRGAALPDEHPLTGVARFIRITRQVQEAVPDLPIVGTGYSWLRQFMPYVAAGVINSGGAALLGIGRGAFAYPDTPKDLMTTGRMDPSRCCIACSACSQIMRDGNHTGCVVRDCEIYGPNYRRARRFSLDRLRAEAQRCRDCEMPTCREGCPAYVDVPAFIKAFAETDIEKAYNILRTCNVLPEMCAHVCPSEEQCEARCVEGTFCLSPIAIRDIQLVVSRLARQDELCGVRLPDNPSGNRVAIVGGGPAGVAAAIKLLEKGHAVTIYERGSKLGGTPESIIPGERYTTAADEIDAILSPARKAGRLEVRFGEALGEKVSLADLRRDYAAVLLAFGLEGSVSLGKAPGVMDALTFLSQVKGGLLKSLPGRVAVLGGGNTAMDAAVTARGLGCRDVYLVYRRSFTEMPAWSMERERCLDAGVHFLILSQPLGYEWGGSGQLAGVKIQRTELGEADSSGRRHPVPVPASEYLLKADMVIEAIGQNIPELLRDSLQGVTLSNNGLIARKANSYATSLENVFAAGDLVNGGTTVVQGIAEGMHAAEEIDIVLRLR